MDLQPQPVCSQLNKRVSSRTQRGQQNGVATEVRHQPQLKLFVVCTQKHPAWRGYKCSPHVALLQQHDEQV
jgi:hypothetical protein